MKFFLLLMIISTSDFVFADISSCYLIQNQDRKNLCLALGHKQPSFCYSIKENDDKNFCLAQVHGQRTFCYSIKYNDLKNQGLGLIK